MPATMVTVEKWADVITDSLVSVDGAMMVEMEDLLLSQQQQNYWKEMNDDSKKNQMRVCWKNNIICRKRKMEV
eukprot:15324081-Ditylum_brightwellii.AAC.1